MTTEYKKRSDVGPQVPFSDELHAMKYRAEGENYREAGNRVASALADSPEHYHAIRGTHHSMRFLFGGRIQAAIGSTKNVTAFNCYVSGTIADSFVDGEGSIMQRATEAAATMRMGGGIGYDFSSLRPRGAMIKKLQSRSSGPVSFMEIFDSICRCVASSGHRRGAQMGVLRVDHPDIEEFIHAKNNSNKLTGFNVSIAVTDEFMAAVQTGKPFPLRWGGEVYKFIEARALWEAIMRSTYDYAEPGVLFIDTINQMNNLYYAETIAATNPCGEQPLPPYGACLLGSINLAKFVSGIETRRTFLWDQLGEDIPHIVRAMDNVIDKSVYPLPEQEAEAKNKRRMGIGVTGLANAGEALGWEYGSENFLEFTDQVLQRIANETYKASALLAEEKGSFPAFNRERFLDGNFVRRLTPETRDLIAKHGLRNSHLTSIAPTGTISLCADNVSSGIEPVFAHSFERTVMEFDGARTERVVDYGLAHFGVEGKPAADVTVEEHVDVLTTASQWVDSAVSKTCNVPKDVDWESFKNIYMQAWQRGAKGCTTFRDGGMRAGVLKKDEDSQPEQVDVEAQAACFIDPVTGRRECA